MKTEMLKMFKPMFKPALAKGQELLKDYLEKIELKEGETHCTVLTDFDENQNILFVVAAFKQKTYSRTVHILKGSEILNYISKVI